MRDRSPVAAYVWLMLIAAAVRVPFALLAPSLGGDGLVYLKVAENILRNFCVSLSDPASQACAPHWGGNQLPGYPAFIAVIWGLFGDHGAPVRLAQTAVAVLAIAWLVRAVHRCVGGRAAVAAGLLLAVSPLQVAWPRHLLTETLALATTAWVFAELVLSLEARRLRLWPLAAALVAAFYVRYDNVLLVVPVAVGAFLIHSPWEAVRRGTVLALVVAVPVGGWLVRNVAVGLSPLPTYYRTAEGAPGPMGYLAWIKTWNTSLYDGARAVFPVASRSYSMIAIPDRAFTDDAERIVVQGLLTELRAYDGQAFPGAIDRRFAELATVRRAARPWQYWLINPARRIAHQWFDPFAGYGWPSEVEDARARERIRRMAEGGVAGIAKAVAAYPEVALMKGLVTGYRYALLALTAFVTVLSVTRLRDPARAIVMLGASYALTRTLALSFFNESRYLVEAIPGMEVAVAVAVVGMWRGRRFTVGSHGRR